MGESKFPATSKPMLTHLNVNNFDLSEERNQILVVGLLQFDSGKTMFAKSLINDSIEKGINVGISKPVSAFSGWYQSKSLERSIELKKLIGADIYELHSVCNSSDPIDIESPLTSLHLPPDPDRVGWQASAYLAISFLDQIVLLRKTTSNKTTNYCVRSNMSRATELLQSKVKDLLNVLEPEPVETTPDFIENLLLGPFDFIDESIQTLAEKHELLIVESYNNAAAPTTGSLFASKVVAVAPGKAAVYSGEVYRKALLATSGLMKPWKKTTEDIIRLIKPEYTIDVEPFKYNGVIERILDF